ncbi:MAG: aldehyde ferredoxin oxidoreductase N-terminal domain-containing protein, partial [Candidatus Hadarchaeum sp.]
MTRAPCYSGKILEVNLSSGDIVKRPLDTNVARKLVGGKGLAAWLLYKMVKPGTDPFSEQNVLIFATGPLTGTIAPSQRGLVCAKSPLTGTFSDSYFGGHFIQELKYAGYDALVVKGKAEKLSYLWIDDDHVEVKDATSLKGQDTTQTNVSIKRELGDFRVKVACIGPAGEKRVKFALVDCDVKRQAGRGGLGAVMGSKNLKAVAIRGTGSVEVARPQEFFEKAKKFHRILIESEAVQAVWSRYGTAGSVEFSNMQGFF